MDQPPGDESQQLTNEDPASADQRLGDASYKEFTASGDAMHLAARLQAAAPAGGTLISHDTYRYVRGVFNLTPRPPLIVKGKSEPLQTYLVREAGF